MIGTNRRSIDFHIGTRQHGQTSGPSPLVQVRFLAQNVNVNTGYFYHDIDVYLISVSLTALIAIWSWDSLLKFRRVPPAVAHEI